MRVLFVIPGSGLNNEQIFSRRQAVALREAGIEVEIFNIGVWRGIPHWLPEVRRLRAAVRLFNPDLVHAQFGTMTGVSALVVAPGRLIVTFRGSDVLAPPPWSARTIVARVASQIVAPFALEIVCVSECVRRALRWPIGSQHVIPSGVDLKVFHRIDSDIARKAMGWGAEEAVVLVYVGQNPDGKGLPLAEEAIRQVSALLPYVRLEILTGQIAPDRMPAVLSAADCLLVASRSEGSPDIVKEALACTLPVVSVGAGDIPEMLDGLPGCFLCDRTARALADGLLASLSRRARCEAGPERMATMYSPDVSTRRLIEVYENALHQKR